MHFKVLACDVMLAVSFCIMIHIKLLNNFTDNRLQNNVLVSYKGPSSVGVLLEI